MDCKKFIFERSMRKRAFCTGILFSALIAGLDPYFIFMGKDVRLCWDHWAPAAIFFLFILCLLSMIHRRLALNPAELMLVFIMSSTASVIPSRGFMTFFISTISGFRYFDNPANRWAEYILDRISPLMTVQDGKAISYFYEGLPPGQSIPYLSWAKPLGLFMVFLLSFSFLSICLMVIFRKQWMEREKLSYPLTILPLEMVKNDEMKRVPPLFRNSLFWLGIILVFSFYLMNWISAFHTGKVVARLGGEMSLFRGIIRLPVQTHFAIIGLIYLVPRSVSLSLWLFYILFTVQEGFLRMSGFSLPGTNEPFCGRSAVTTFEGAGAMLTLVAALLWNSRRQIRDCARKAFFRDENIDDSGEMLSYRISVFGFIISFGIMASFLKFFGLSWPVSVIFLFFTVAVFLGLSRIVCQAGFPLARPNCIPSVYTAYLLPADMVSPRGYAVLGMQGSWTSYIRTSIMSTTGNSLKISEEQKMSGRTVFAGIMAAIAVSYIVSAWVHIYMGCKLGALNVSDTVGGSFFNGGISRNVAGFIIPKIDQPVSGEIIRSRYIFTAVGAFAMAILMFLHSRFLWWPVHYLGFPIADAHPMLYYWFSIMTAWIVKGLMLRFGGHAVYRKSIPFFLGLILGNVLWIVVQGLLNILLDKSVIIVS